jgi:hypothetical protein
MFALTTDVTLEGFHMPFFEKIGQPLEKGLHFPKRKAGYHVF